MRRTLREFGLNIRQSPLLLYAFLGFLLLLGDQVTKLFAYSGQFGNFLNYLAPVVSKDIFANHDFAFSLKIPHSLMWVIYIVLLSMLVTWFLKAKEKSQKMTLALTLVLSGALSNIFDRLMLGFVRDFIHVFWGNTFNLADVYIIAGIVLMITDNSK